MNFKLIRSLLILPAFFILISGKAQPIEKQIDIVISATANKQELKAADQLRIYLSEIYPDYRLTVANRSDKKHYNVYFKDQDTKAFLSEGEEGFKIQRLNEKQVVLSAGSAKGYFNAVYSLLERLGYGFYLSYDAKPLPKKELNFSEWEISDFPLQAERIIFNWHNFLSGCTGWNYEDWCSWVDQSAKMRYNTLMVHAYGNNPMFSFEYKGAKKPVGYLNTSRSGRDWGAQHVNDVRRLPGGEVFSAPVLGSSAALVPEDQRSQAATRLMSRVFEHAQQMAMKINFAIDVDTWSSNPMNIIEKLPQSCRIKLKEQDIVNPDTPEGYLYYKAQVSSLMSNYPQISTITLFIRNGRSLWNDMTADQIPESWSKEWKEQMVKSPELQQYNHAPSLFITSKVVKAFQRALKELKKEKVTVAFGSFNLETVPYAALLLPSQCPVIFLEEMVNFEVEKRKEILNKLGQNRKITVIFYAHHDDHRYLGRPYAPFADFNNQLKQRNLSGFGLLHWTTRPLDLLFKSMGDQVWNASENENLDSTLTQYCRTTFGSDPKVLNKYVKEWITRGPMFGRETMDHFFDPGKQMFGEKYEPAEVTFKGIAERKNLLQKIDPSMLSEMGKKRYQYDLAMEDFYLSVLKNQEDFRKAYEMLNRGSQDSARQILERVSPEKAIALYAKVSGIMPITMGEKAVIVSMGTRWLPDFINLKQRARMMDICYKFQATSHDSLAQQPGINTYFIDQEKRLWSCLGEKELKSGVTGYFDQKSRFPEISLTYFEITQPLSLPLVTIGKDNLAAGKYRLEISYQSVAKEPGLRISGNNGKEQLQGTVQSTVHGLRTISAVIEVKDNQKKWLEVTPGEKELLLTNLVIQPL